MPENILLDRQGRIALITIDLAAGTKEEGVKAFLEKRKPEFKGR